MNKKIYEFYFRFGYTGYVHTYELSIDRETDLMYYGVVYPYREGHRPAHGRFALRKSKINQAEIINDRDVCVRTMGDSCEQAKKAAAKIAADKVLNWVNEFQKYV
jgi:hypothetical protein